MIADKHCVLVPVRKWLVRGAEIVPDRDRFYVLPRSLRPGEANGTQTARTLEN
jgi:hypothetical protein